MNLLKHFNPVSIGHSACFSAFGFILFEGITVFNVGFFITGTAVSSFGVKYMKNRVANEVHKQIESSGAKVIHVALMSDNEYLVVARREDKTSFYLTVNKHGDYCPFDSDATAIDNLRRIGTF